MIKDFLEEIIIHNIMIYMSFNKLKSLIILIIRISL